MSNDANIIRLAPHGSGQNCISRDRDKSVNFAPENSAYQYYTDPDLGLTVGISTISTGPGKPAPYSGDEFMHVLEGQVTMIDAHGAETFVKQGNTLCIGDKSHTGWKQYGAFRKLYLTFQPDESDPPVIPNGGMGIHMFNREDLTENLTSIDVSFPFEFEHTRPQQRDATAFVNDTRNMYAGMWDSTPFESKMAPFPFHILIQILSGEVEITDKSGCIQKFVTGDVLFIPRGTECSCKTTDPISLYYCIIV